MNKMMRLLDSDFYRFLKEVYDNKGKFRIYVLVILLSFAISGMSWFIADSEETNLLKRYAVFIFFYVFVGITFCGLLEVIEVFISTANRAQEDLEKESCNSIEARQNLHDMILECFQLERSYCNVPIRTPSTGSIQRSLTREVSTANLEEKPVKQEQHQEEELPKRELGPSLKFSMPETQFKQTDQLPKGESNTIEAQLDRDDDLPKRELGPLLRSSSSNRRKL